MTGQLLIGVADGRVTGFRADDLIVAALEHAIRFHVTHGGTMFLSGAAEHVTGRTRTTTLLTPMTTMLFTYTDLDDDSHATPKLRRLVDQYRRQIYLEGGIVLDAADLQLIDLA